MVNDPQRTPALLGAIATAVGPGDIVIDIGTGLGLLAIAAVKAGARKVWALDVDRPALREARRRAEQSNVSEQITFLEKLSFDFVPPQRADLIVCETVGSFAFEENILATLSDAKQRLLNKKGRIVPTRLELWGALLCRKPRLTLPAEIGIVKREEMLSLPTRLAAVDFSARFSEAMRLRASFSVRHAGIACAVALWPRIQWWGRRLSDASPFLAPTHWKQGILPLEARKAIKGETLGIELIIEPDPANPHVHTQRLWRWIQETPRSRYAHALKG